MGKYFVAASAETNTWDLSAENIVFAEYGCIKEAIVNEMSNTNFIMPSSRWDDCKNIKEETVFLNQIQEDVLRRLTDGYNKMWRLSLTAKEVYTLLHPWLDFYVEVMYYKFFTVEDIVSRYKDVYMWGLQEKDFYYCDSPMDFMIRVAKDDSMNLQLYTMIAHYKGIPIEKYIKKEDICNSDKKNSVIKRNSSSFIKRLVRFSIRRIGQVIKYMRCSFINFLSHGSETIVINPTRFFMSYKELVQLLWHTKCKVGAYYYDFVKMKPVSYNKKTRTEFALDQENVLCDFEDFLLTRIAYDIPVKCMEGFDNLYHIKDIEKYKKVKKIVSTSDAKCHDSAKAFVMSKRKECVWYYSEIGGSGGIWSGREESEGEEKISDVYYTNGWTYEPSISELRPFYNLRFIKAAVNDRHDVARKGIMYGGTFIARYKCMHANSICRNPQNYMDNCLKLFENLASLDIEVVARLYPDAGWGFREKVEKKFPNIIIDDYKEEFQVAVKRYKLYIVDVISTTWGEAYAAGVPIMFVGNRKFEHYSSGGEYWVNKLRSCGVYQEDGESAGKYIASIIHNIEEWWNDTERQKIVQEFAAIYANIPESSEKNIWVEEIINISNEAVKK